MQARDKLKQNLLDAIGCALAAFRAGPLEAIRTADAAGANSGPVPMIGGGRNTPERAVFYNGALTRYLDFMDAKQ
jgi:2-methylcitrate dehydratase